MTVSGMTTAMLNLEAAKQVSQLQIAVAKKAMDTAKLQGDAATQLIEAAADGMAEAAAQVNDAIGQMVDIHA